MNRSMLICVTLPLALPLLGCTDDGPQGTESADETGITTANGDGDGDPDTGDGDGDSDGEDKGEDPGDGDGDEGKQDCGTVKIVPEYTPPNVMLVVDGSGSMVDNKWDHDLNPGTADETRWKTLHRVVDTVMAEFGPAMNAGLQRFPSANATKTWDEGACIVSPTPEVSIGLNNGPAILAALPPADATDEIKGGTPATHGINSAVDHLKAQSPENPRYILFITDGAANCTPGLVGGEALETYDETLEPTVKAAYVQHDITTFVVGIDIVDAVVGKGTDGAPEANPFERLNDIALAGGAPKNMGAEDEKFFNSTNQDELLMAVGGIIGEITDCVIDLSETEEGVPDPIQIPYTEFTADGEKVPFVDDCENEDGWTWLEEGVKLTFCGSFCDAFKGGGVVFDGTYGCPPAH